MARVAVLSLVLLAVLHVAVAQFANRYATALTDATIQEAIERGPVLLCVCVPFMGACKEFHPQWEEVARRVKEAGRGPLVATLNLWDNHVSKVRFDAKDMPWILLLKDGKFHHYPVTGLALDKTPAIVEPLLAFGETGETDSHREKATGPKKADFQARTGTIPAIPVVPQWFTTHDYHNAYDGKTYRGAD